jgi:hypothetical protein
MAAAGTAAAGTVVAGTVVAIAEATTAVVGVGADLPPVQLSERCLQRPTIIGAARTTTTTDLRTARWRTACGVSDRMILVAERI